MDPMRFWCTVVTVALAFSLPVVIEGFHQVAFCSHGEYMRSGDAPTGWNSKSCSANTITRKTTTKRLQYEFHGRCQTTPTTLSMIDPITTWNTLGGMDAVVATLVGNGPEIGAAVVGAAAGALSQVPKIQQLHGQIAEMQIELEQSQTNLTAKIQLLEDKLFEMDREFEDQTARFKRQYDSTQRERLEQIKEKLKTEYQFKLEIQREERKSEELMKQVDKEHNRTSQQQDLSILSLEKQRLEEANVKLEQALLQSEMEFKHMLEAAAEKARKRFFLF